MSVVFPGAVGIRGGGWRSGGAAVLVMEPAEMRKSDDVARVRGVNGSWLRALLGQRQVSSRRVVVGHVGAKHTMQMSLVENDVVVETVSPNRPDEPLHVGIRQGERGALSTSCRPRLLTRRRNISPYI